MAMKIRCRHCAPGQHCEHFEEEDFVKVKQPWEVLDNDEADAIADFGGLPVEKVRAIEMLVLLKAGKTKVRG